MRVALGFRAHSGWAVLVALAGTRSAATVVDRRSIELAKGNGREHGPRQPYHMAEGLPLERAEKLIRRCEESSRRLALGGLRDCLAQVSPQHELVGCSLLLAAGRPLGTLADTLASHAKIHTADGEHFRDALRHAVGACGLRLNPVREREVLRDLSAALGLTEGEIGRRLGDLGRAVGPPWRKDEKLAAAAAWLLLAGN
jgi:hypothetical protein